jgi:hypothetical protein
VVLVAPVVAAVVGVVPKWFAIPAIIGLAAVGLAAVASWALDNDTPW